jgi:predicted nucleotidyltransferase
MQKSLRPTETRPQFDFDQIDPQTKHVTPRLIAAIADRIVQHLHPTTVVLFGSQASGKATKGSDIDLLVIIEDTHSFAVLKRRARFGKLLALFPFRSFGLDAIILTNAEVQALQKTNAGEWDLVLEILNEGKILYGNTTTTPGQRTRAATDARVVSQS